MDEEDTDLTLSRDKKVSVHDIFEQQSKRIKTNTDDIAEHNELLLGSKKVDGERGLIAVVRQHTFYFKITMWAIGALGTIAGIILTLWAILKS